MPQRSKARSVQRLQVKELRAIGAVISALSFETRKRFGLFQSNVRRHSKRIYLSSRRGPERFRIWRSWLISISPRRQKIAYLGSLEILDRKAGGGCKRLSDSLGQNARISRQIALTGNLPQCFAAAFSSLIFSWIKRGTAPQVKQRGG